MWVCVYWHSISPNKSQNFLVCEHISAESLISRHSYSSGFFHGLVRMHYIQYNAGNVQFTQNCSCSLLWFHLLQHRKHRKWAAYEKSANFTKYLPLQLTQNCVQIIVCCKCHHVCMKHIAKHLGNMYPFNSITCKWFVYIFIIFMLAIPIAIHMWNCIIKSYWQITKIIFIGYFNHPLWQKMSKFTYFVHLMTGTFSLFL